MQYVEIIGNESGFVLYEIFNHLENTEDQDYSNIYNELYKYDVNVAIYIIQYVWEILDEAVYLLENESEKLDESNKSDNESHNESHNESDNESHKSDNESDNESNNESDNTTLEDLQKLIKENDICLESLEEKINVNIKELNEVKTNQEKIKSVYAKYEEDRKLLDLPWNASIIDIDKERTKNEIEKKRLQSIAQKIGSYANEI